MFNLFGKPGDTLFDFNGDGKTDPVEAALGMMMAEDIFGDDEDSDEALDEEDSELLTMTGYTHDELELMDAEERAEILEDAGYEPDDFGFDDF